ncbi:MAG: hypothetical protein ACYSUS_10345 [Planctomycetota bacterium]|jgi:hypothetical protein
MPITNQFIPGDSFFQHSDLVTLESPDYYPDGRDLGENYTITSWRMSPCIQPKELDCIFCHTSSGRFRFKDTPNDACTSCHPEKEKDFQAHTHHEKGDVHRPFDAAADAVGDDSIQVAQCLQFLS